MRFRDIATILAAGAGAIGGAMLVYGALVESNRLVVDRLKLRLPGWPQKLSGYKIAVLADLHLRDKYSIALANRAVVAALEAEPDMIVVPGDVVGYWKPESAWMIEEVFRPLQAMQGNVIVTPGNHEYWSGNPEILRIVVEHLGFEFLRNQSILIDDIRWIGLDSANRGEPNLESSFEEAANHPKVVLWHEPDFVDSLPSGCALQISGHSHGGQFVLPGGIIPMTTTNGRKYIDGFYPDAPTPIYVSRGIGTTGPPSRFNCPPTVGILTLLSDEV